MYPNTTKESNILAKALHGLSKPYILLIKDLPFVTDLSKYYDKCMINSDYINSLYSKVTCSDKNDLYQLA